MSQIIEKAVAVIIKDKKLLLVNGNNQEFYWTPGGKLEPGENPTEALKRELKEELGIVASDIRPYFTYLSEQEEDQRIRKVYNFFVEYEDQLIPNNEIQNIHWISKRSFEENEILIQLGVKIHLIPKLISDGLL